MWKNFLKYLLIQVWLIKVNFLITNALDEQKDDTYNVVSSSYKLTEMCGLLHGAKISNGNYKCLSLEKVLVVDSELNESVVWRTRKARVLLWPIDIIGCRRMILHGAPSVLGTPGLAGSSGPLSPGPPIHLGVI